MLCHAISLSGNMPSLCALCVHAFASYFVGRIRSEEVACLRKLVAFLPTSPEEVARVRELVQCLALSASDVLASGQRQTRHRPLQAQQRA